MRVFFIAVSSLKVNQDAGTRQKRRVHSYTANLVPAIKNLAKSLNYKALFDALRLAWHSPRKLGKQNTENCHSRAPPAFPSRLAKIEISAQNQALARCHAAPAPVSMLLHRYSCDYPHAGQRTSSGAPGSTFNIELLDHPVQRHARHAQVACRLADIAAGTGQAGLHGVTVRTPANTAECDIGARRVRN